MAKFNNLPKISFAPRPKAQPSLGALLSQQVLGIMAAKAAEAKPEAQPPEVTAMVEASAPAKHEMPRLRHPTHLPTQRVMQLQAPVATPEQEPAEVVEEFDDMADHPLVHRIMKEEGRVEEGSCVEKGWHNVDYPQFMRNMRSTAHRRRSLARMLEKAKRLVSQGPNKFSFRQRMAEAEQSALDDAKEGLLEKVHQGLHNIPKVGKKGRVPLEVRRRYEKAKEDFLLATRPARIAEVKRKLRYDRRFSTGYEESKGLLKYAAMNPAKEKILSRRREARQHAEMRRWK